MHVFCINVRATKERHIKTSFIVNYENYMSKNLFYLLLKIL